jgi:hypothetical protein
MKEARPEKEARSELISESSAANIDVVKWKQ